MISPSSDIGNQRVNSPWLTPIEASRYIGVALGTLRNWTSARFIPFAKRGGTVRYHRDTLDTWLSSGVCIELTPASDVGSADPN